MNIQIKDLLAQINKLERQIKALNEKTKIFDSGAYYSKNKKFLNFSCVEKQLLDIDKVFLSKDEELLIECVVELNAMAEQEVELCLIVGDIAIAKTIKKLDIRTSQYSFNQTYMAPQSGEVEIKLLINPNSNKQVLVQNCILNIWGYLHQENKPKYDVIDVGDKYLISCLDNEMLFYKIIDKDILEFNEYDLDFCVYAKDYSFVFNADSNEIFLLRIDIDENLFIDNFSTGKSSFVAAGIKSVSAICSAGKIVAAVNKNNKCIIFDFVNEKVFSVQNIGYEFIIKNCLLFKNDKSEKVYLVLTLKNGKNIMLEASDMLETDGENLDVNCLVEVLCYEVENEV